MLTQRMWRQGTSECVYTHTHTPLHTHPNTHTHTHTHPFLPWIGAQRVRHLAQRTHFPLTYRGCFSNCTRASSAIRLGNGWLLLTTAPSLPQSPSCSIKHRRDKKDVNDKTPHSAANKGLFPAPLPCFLAFHSLPLEKPQRRTASSILSYHAHLSHSPKPSSSFQLAPCLLPQGE